MHRLFFMFTGGFQIFCPSHPSEPAFAPSPWLRRLRRRLVRGGPAQRGAAGVGAGPGAVSAPAAGGVGEPRHGKAVFHRGLMDADFVLLAGLVG